MSLCTELKPLFVQSMRLPEKNMAPYKDRNLCDTCRGITIDVLLSSHGYCPETPSPAAEWSCIMCCIAQGYIIDVFTNERIRLTARTEQKTYLWSSSRSGGVGLRTLSTDDG